MPEKNKQINLNIEVIMKSKIFLFISILLLCAGFLAAQVKTSGNFDRTDAITGGTLSGRVASSTGSGIPEVEVNSANTVTGKIQQTETDNQGRFSFSLSPGTYIIAPALPGYLVNPSHRIIEHDGTTIDINFEAEPFISTPSGTGNDFDGDGKSDVAVYRPPNGTWYVAPSLSAPDPNAPDAPQSFYGVKWGLPNDLITPADFDGDGKTDFAVWRRADAKNPDKSYFYILNSSDGTFRTEQFGIREDLPFLVGDWDGDGKADPAVYRGGTPENPQSFFYYRPSSQPGVDFVTLNWGTSGDHPVRGDFDGDGRFDAAVFRRSNNVWYILQSSDNQPRFARWGLNTDKFFPADYDGDGKTDLAVVRNGIWYILQSSTDQPRYIHWGLSSDRFVPGDYDGDGKTDVAVNRNGIWYIWLSQSGEMKIANFGGTNDIPVQSAGFFNLVD